MTMKTSSPARAAATSILTTMKVGTMTTMMTRTTRCGQANLQKLLTESAEASMKVGRRRREDSTLDIQRQGKMSFRALVRKPVKVAA